MLPSKKRTAFALVELFVAMHTVVVLYAVVVGPSRESLQRQELSRCAEILRKLHLTLTLDANEHDGASPAAERAANSDAALAALVPRYSSDRSIFACPAKGHIGRQFDFAQRPRCTLENLQGQPRHPLDLLVRRQLARHRVRGQILE